MPPSQAKRVELILRQLDQLPTLPTVALRVLEVTADANASMPELARLIESDLALTVSLLHYVRRAELAVREEVTTVERAIVLLGLETVRSVVLAVSIFDVLESSNGRKPSAGDTFSREEFWKHSVAVACAAELLGEALVQTHGKALGINPGEAFVCGLLHDLGKVALDAILPKSFAKVAEATDLLRANIADMERQVIGLDHLIAGKRLAERWELPAVLCESIWLHGQLPQALPRGIRNARMVNLITLADLIAREQHIGYSGNYSFDLPRQELMAAVGLSSAAMDAKLAGLLERIENRAALLNLNVASSQELYQQAMKRANQELGRVTTQLAMKNRRLATRAQFFDRLGAFQSELRADATVPAVMTAIGQSAINTLEAGSVAVFSLSPGEIFAEAMLLDKNGVAFDTTLVDCSDAPSAVASDGPVLAAGQEMDWLLAAIGPRLAAEKRFWICLVAEGRCVGGVVWGAAAGEAQRLGLQTQELTALAGAWQLALRMTQVRQDSRHLSEQLAQANRELAAQQGDMQRARLMTSVAEMAAGAAHEMNNPLAVIAGRSQLLAAQLADLKQQGLARLIHEQSERLSSIITELMECAKPSRPEIASCDVAELVAIALRQAKARGEVADRTIETTMAAVPQVAVDHLQVAAALTEVIDNALLATQEQGGHVEIHAAFDPVSRNVAVTVCDDGVGMDDSTLRRAFDPFFSSQPAGRRRGLGLAKAQRWIAGSGGLIKLESRPGRGTRAVILLPSAAAEEWRTQERKAAF